MSNEPLLTEPTAPAAPASEPGIAAAPPTVEAPPAPAPVVEGAAALSLDDIKVPEGFTPLSEDLRKGFIDTLNDSALDAKGRMEALLGLQQKAAEEITKGMMDTWAKQQETDLAEIKTAYGATLDATLVSCAKVLDTFGSPELRKVLDDTGAGNKKPVVDFLMKVAAQMTEGSHVAATAPQQGRDIARSLYPTMEK